MRKIFIAFVIICIIACWGRVWYLYNQPGQILSSSIDNILKPHSQQNEVENTVNHFTLRGTEPFWYLEYTGWDLLWQIPWNTGSETTIFTGITQTMSGGSYVFDDNTNTIKIVLTSWTCSDGMSEIVYTWIALITFSTWPNLPQYNGCSTW